MTKTRRLHLRLEEKVVDKLQKMADLGFEKNLTAALEGVLDFFFGLDPEFMTLLSNTAGQLGQELPRVIENIIIRSIATEAAHQEVFGEVSPRCFTEFSPRQGRLLRGDELFQALHDEAVLIFKALKVRQESGELPAMKETKTMLMEAVH